MGKEKTELQEEKAALQHDAAAQEQQASEAQEVQEPENQEAQDPEEPKEEAHKVTVIVLAHPGTEMLVKHLWEKQFPAGVEVLTFPEDASLKELLADVIAAPEFENDFVLVPANLVPVAPVTLADLTLARVDVSKDRKRFWGRVPVAFTKESLVEFLPEHDELDDDAFVEAYLKARSVRPADVSHSFGNFYTKVLRGDPCLNVVIEALIRKRFIYANATGWNAITGLLEKYLAE